MTGQTNFALSSDYPRVAGRYVMFKPFARGGMASVHLGRLMGPAGFSRTVAIKRMHEEFAHNPEFVAMFLDEARLAARVSHPNVVATLDVVALKAELLLVMEYICGESLMGLINRCRDTSRLPAVPIAVDCAIGMLNGLHAAHEAKHADGRLLGLVHRDVTPHNVLLGLDGVARVVDFGIAKATGTAHRTRVGEIKGKLSYLAPEQLQGADVSRATDIYSASLVLWETLTCERLFKGDNEGAIIHDVLVHRLIPPSRLRPGIPTALDDVVLRGLDADPTKRWGTAKEMAEALETAVSPVARSAVAAWVQETARPALLERQQSLAYVESYSAPGGIPLPSSFPPAPPDRLPLADEPPSLDESGAYVLRASLARTKRPPRMRQRRTLMVRGVIAVALLLGVGLGMYALVRSKPLPSAPAPSQTAAVQGASSAAEPSIERAASPLADGDSPIVPAAASSTAKDTSHRANKLPRKRLPSTAPTRASPRVADPLYRRD